MTHRNGEIAPRVKRISRCGLVSLHDRDHGFDILEFEGS